MNRVALAVLIALGLAGGLTGCGDFYWEKPGTGSADFQRDSDSCRQQSAAGQWDSCMKARGWRYSAGW